MKERKIATKALVSITSGAGVECLSAGILEYRALLQELTEITFSDEDMEVGYPDHRRPLYLAVSINQISIKRALVDRCFCKSHPDRKSTRLNSSHSDSSRMPSSA